MLVTIFALQSWGSFCLAACRGRMRKKTGYMFLLAAGVVGAALALGFSQMGY